MRKLRQNQKIRIEFFDQRIAAKVECVVPIENESGRFQIVTLLVSEPFIEGDVIYWLDDSGKREWESPVLNVLWGQEETKIVVKIPVTTSRFWDR
jgi:hypothetical protein